MQLKKPLIKIASTLLVTNLLFPQTAMAVDKPNMSNVTAAIPDGGDPKPIVPMKQISNCAKSTLTKDIDLKVPQPNALTYHLEDLHKYATGKGITVAVIDSGVTPNPRLTNLQGGGDYVMGEDGLKDCDHHGTLVAGIIAAQKSDSDAFVGVAPDARILSIRQTSGAFGPANEADASKATSTLATLASGIVRAVNMGANVINMSVTSCYPADSAVDTNDLKAAINYAHQKGVVLVTAAGNADPESCVTNPSFDPSNPQDPRNWAGATHVSMPSYYTPSIISVGGSDPKGNPFLATMAGPWVDVAAPATDIVSLDPGGNGTLINASIDNQGQPSKLTGTSFASAYVSGLVALLLEKDKSLKPDDISYILTHTARPGPDNIVNILGEGVVDPVAALTTTGYPQNKDKKNYVEAEKETVLSDKYFLAKVIVAGIFLLGVLILTVLLTGIVTRNVDKTQRKTQ